MRLPKNVLPFIVLVLIVFIVCLLLALLQGLG